MKKTLIVVVLIFNAIFLLNGQNVDSIKVEQTGDFIKIGYRITDSKPGQVFRVRALCSINGGLNTELRSVSGDVGDNVQGGKDEYFVVWDVLKDVDELRSAEFIVRAELVKDVSSGSNSGKDVELTKVWSKKWILIGPAVGAPGPCVGFMAGIMGSFGIAAVFTFGKYAIDGDVPVPVGVNVSADEFISDEKVTPITVLLTKRIVNYNSFQMHLMAGIQRTRLVFLVPGAMDTPYNLEKLFGPAAGMTFGANRVAFTLLMAHIDPGPVEKGSDYMALSPLSYLSASIGLRF